MQTQRIVRATGISALSVVALLSCSSPSSSRSIPKEELSKSVFIETFSFKPQNLDVTTGTKVTWNQRDNTVHTVTSGSAGPVDPATSRANQTLPDGKFESRELAQGKTFSFTFKESGSFEYFCRIHPEGMRGAIKVAD